MTVMAQGFLSEHLDLEEEAASVDLAVEGDMAHEEGTSNEDVTVMAAIAMKPERHMNLETTLHTP